MRLVLKKSPRVMAGAVTAALTVALAGCGGSTTPPTGAGSAPHKVVDITYWAGHGSGALYKAVVAEVAQFNATHKYIHVTFKPTGASHHGLAAFEAGQAPNVGMVSGYIVPQLANAGAIVNVQSWLKGPQGLTPSQIRSLYYPVVWQDMQAPNGKQYEMPLEKKSLLVLYYNKPLFQKAGITSPPTTWAQVGQDAQKITHLGPQYHGIAWTPSLRQLFDITLADGGTVFTTATHRKAFNLNNAGATQALTMLRSWVANGSMIMTSGYQYQLDFGTGDVGMLIDASAGYTYDKGSVGGKFAMGGVPDPAGSSGHSSQEINGSSLVMFNVGSAAQKQASWTFMKWMSSPSTNVYWDEHTNYLPLGPQEYQTMQPYYAQHPAQAASYSNPSQWWFKPRISTYEAAKTAMEAIYDKALRGQISVQAALQQMTTVGNQYLSGQVRG